MLPCYIDLSFYLVEVLPKETPVVDKGKAHTAPSKKKKASAEQKQLVLASPKLLQRNIVKSQRIDN